MITSVPPIVAMPLFLALGLTIGSFGNVVIGRVPAGETLQGRSHCPHCGRTLRAWELIPVLSWMMLWGHCSGCKQRISMQYPMIELATALLFLFAILSTGYDLVTGLLFAIALWAMLMILMIDLRTQLIPDSLTITLGVSALLLQVLTGTVPIVAPLIGLGFFGLQWLLSRGKWVGSGDIFLAAALGFLLGTWQLMVLSLFAAYISGALVAAVLLLTGSVKRGANLPFGPFLIGGAFVTLLFGDRILLALFP